MSTPAQQDSAETTEATVRVGRTLRDKWHLDALIDVGGMAAVYAATHRNGMRGAVKILHRDRSLQPEIAARFRREGYIANKVAHPNAVTVLDDDVALDGSAFLVMELLEGSTLRDRAGACGGRLSADEVLLAADQLLDVLAAAHDVAVVHRDVKPDNVFVTDEGQIKILDFGIARLYEPSGAEHSETVAGLPMGSPAFMSPEQARGRWDLVGAQSDIWSVGATMFTLLSGQDVHSAETLPELLAAIFTKPAPSLAVAVPDAHPAIVEVVDRALQQRLTDRWPDARTMQAAVRRAYLDVSGTALPVGVRPAQRPRRTVASSEGRLESNASAAVALTVVAARSSSRRYPRGVALATAFLLAGALGVLGAGVAWRQRAPEPGGFLAGLGEATASFSTIPASPSPPLLAPRDVPLPPVSRAPLASSAGPVPRGHRRSVYDRRN